jgi:hypothetical protein
MNQNTQSLYSASSIEELKEAIRLNPDVNESIPPYRVNALRTLLTSGYFIGEVHYSYTPIKIKSDIELLEMVKLHLDSGADKEYCIDVVLWTSHSHEFKKKLIGLLMDYKAKPKMTKNILQHYNQELVNYAFEGYYLEKIKKSLCASIIQNWFLKKYYDPYHPYGKSRLEKVFLILENDLKNLK